MHDTAGGNRRHAAGPVRQGVALDPAQEQHQLVRRQHHRRPADFLQVGHDSDILGHLELSPDMAVEMRC